MSKKETPDTPTINKPQAKLNSSQRFELMKMATEMCTDPHTKFINSKDVIKTYRELIEAISE